MNLDNKLLIKLKKEEKENRKQGRKKERIAN